jgi:hypothetical protein
MTSEKIGAAAGAVWRALSDDGPQNMVTLKRKLKLDDKWLCLALGWLAREDKISFQKRKTGKSLFP